MSKQRTHNEYFRQVYVKTLHGYRSRDESLIDEIMSRPEYVSMSREERLDFRRELQEPYKTIIGYTSSRKSCPNCKEKLGKDEWIWSWGEYVNAKWNTVMHFCKYCFPEDVRTRLIVHRDECGCDFQLIAYGGKELPEWLSLPETSKTIIND